MSQPGMDRQKMIEQEIIHDEDHAANYGKLKGLYGRVADSQNRLILSQCVGRRVLDVGAGYGNLTAALRDAGFEPTAIEVDEEKIALAKEWFGVDIDAGDIHHTRFDDGAFDTVVFREVVNHLRLGEAFREAARLATQRIIIFQHNRLWPLRLAYRICRHREHATYSEANIIEQSRTVGFGRIRVRYRDVLALPLSGGYIGYQLVPTWRWLLATVMGIDRVLAACVNALLLGRWACFRRMIIAERTPSDEA